MYVLTLLPCRSERLLETLLSVVRLESVASVRRLVELEGVYQIPFSSNGEKSRTPNIVVGIALAFTYIFEIFVFSCSLKPDRK